MNRNRAARPTGRQAGTALTWLPRGQGAAEISPLEGMGGPAAPDLVTAVIVRLCADPGVAEDFKRGLRVALAVLREMKEIAS